MSGQVFFKEQNESAISDYYESRGGIAILNVRADSFGEAKVKLQVASKNDTYMRWMDLDQGFFTESATVRIQYLPVGLLIRAIIFDADSDTENLFVEVMQ